MDKIVLIEYCDKCAEEYSYPTEDEVMVIDKVRGDCKLCGRIGWLNQTLQSNIVNCKDVNDSTWKGGGFTVEQLSPFPLGQFREKVHPTLAYKLLTKKCILYYDKDVIILANGQTGQQIRIKF